MTLLHAMRARCSSRIQSTDNRAYRELHWRGFRFTTIDGETRTQTRFNTVCWRHRLNSRTNDLDDWLLACNRAARMLRDQGHLPWNVLEPDEIYNIEDDDAYAAALLAYEAESALNTRLSAASTVTEPK